MKKLYWLLSFVIVSFLFFQCQKENSFIGGPDTGGSVTPDPITTSLQGNVIDENDQPATGVAVTAGAGMAITDANGYFRFTNAMLDKNTTLVTAEKDGYFKGYRVLAATSGCNQVVIKLIKKDLAGIVPASAGGEASLSNGAKVSLPANGVVTASSNSDYSGDVKVYASYINPKSSDIGKTIPGSLVANDKNGKRVILSSYGMLAVELSSASGEKLQIKSGSVATLTIPIPSSSVASAPATIPLWYIDEPTGIWQEEGSATKQGTNYVGEVKHFSFWNCDYQYPAVNVSFTLQTTDGLPLVNAYVEIVPTDSTGGLSHGYTDSLGQVKGLVPANKNLKFLVYNNCYGAVYEQNISPLSESTDLGIIKVSGITTSIVTFSGTILNCNSQTVTNGYALINFDNMTRYVSVDSNTGRYTTTYVICSTSPATATILGVDANSQQQSSLTTVSTTYPVTDAGNITACGTSSEQYIKYSLDGVQYTADGSSSDSLIYGAPNDSSGTIISGYSFSSGSIWFTISGDKKGTFPINSLFLDNYSTVDLDQPSTVTFTTIPASVGNFYEGSMTGKFITNRSTDSAVTHNITGTFRVRRSF